MRYTNQAHTQVGKVRHRPENGEKRVDLPLPPECKGPEVRTEGYEVRAVGKEVLYIMSYRWE